MSTIAAGTSSGTALVSTGNTDGTLQLQVNGTTPSVTLAANGSIGVGSTPGYGTNGQVLTSSGTGSAPTWATPAGGGIVTIASGSFPAAAVLDITSIPATYAYLVVQVNGVSSNTGSNFLLTQVSVNNGTSFDTTANNYLGQMLNSAAVSNTSLATLGTYASTAGAAELGYATIVLQGYQGGCNLTYGGRIAHSLTDRERTLGTYVGSTSAINALRFTWSAGGNFDAGTYALYGVS
jgi:hypothetical protein